MIITGDSLHSYTRFVRVVWLVGLPVGRCKEISYNKTKERRTEVDTSAVYRITRRWKFPIGRG